VSTEEWARQWDVVVVGGRLAGAVTAHALAPWARDVLVVERTRPEMFWPQQLSWDRPVNLLWADLGLIDTVLACGAPRLRGITRRVLGVSVGGQFPVDDEHSYRMSVARDVLDPALADRAAKHPNVRVLRPARVVEPVLAGPRVTGVRIVHEGVTAEVPATLVVFADGRRSQAPGWLGAVEYASIPSPWTTLISYRTELPLPHDHIYYARTPGSLLTVIPTGPNQWCVGTILHEELIARQGVAAARLHEQTAVEDPVLGPALAVGRRASRVGGAGRLRMYRRPMTGPGWCLVGDSGLHLDPMSAMGCRAALVTAKLLRDRVAELGRVSRDPADYAALTRRRDALLDREWASTRQGIGVEEGRSAARGLDADAALLETTQRGMLGA
jgi:flavin-dependent dehydrogenase